MEVLNLNLFKSVKSNLFKLVKSC